jgi:hypothetical protein
LAAQGLLGAGAAVEVVEQEGRQLAPGGFAEIGGGRNDHDAQRPDAVLRAGGDMQQHARIAGLARPAPFDVQR